MTTHSSNHRKVVVIGGGLGGIAAACTLAARGHAVTLLERNEWIGGKAAVLQSHGFRFDMGPTILTLPVVLRRIFAEAGRHLDIELPMVRLDPQWRCFFEGGSVLDLVEDVNRMSAEVARFTGEATAGSGYRRFIDVSRRLHDVSDRFFFWKSIGSIRDMMRVGESMNLKTLSDVMSLRMGRSVSGVIRNFATDPRVAQMLDHFTQYVGSAPDQSPAVLCGIAHMQTNDGIWYPMGGTRAVATALEKLARDLGVHIRNNCAVDRILTDDRQQRVLGVRTSDGESMRFDAVVSNMDAVRTFRELIGKKAARRFERSRSTEPACSGVVLYMGLSRRYEQLQHHNFVFSADPHAEFEAIYRQGKPAPDPTCYVCAPARTDASVAPAGGEALYVLVHAPYLRPGQDWKQMFPGYRKIIIDKLARVAGMDDLERRIVFESALTPQDIHDRYHVLHGAIYGIASHGRFLGAFKPANRNRQIKNLYLAGGAAHPGPGMPMVLMSGWIAADSLDADARGGIARDADVGDGNARGNKQTLAVAAP